MPVHLLKISTFQGGGEIDNVILKATMNEILNGEIDKTIDSIIEKKSESDAKAFLSGGQISFINTLMKGLDDFELICFLVIREEEC